MIVILIKNYLNILCHFIISLILFSFIYLEFDTIFDLKRKAAERKEGQRYTMYFAEGNGAIYETKFVNTRS